MIKKLLFLLTILCVLGFTPPTANYTADEYDVLLIHADQADGTAGTDIIDSATSKTITAGGDAQVDTAQYKNLTGSTGSILFDGTGDYLTLANSDDWAFPADWTMDFWVRFASLRTEEGTDCYLFSGTGHTPFSIWMYHNGTALNLAIYRDGGSFYVKPLWYPEINTWYHLAFGRAGTAYNTYMNGVSIGSTTNSSNFASAEIFIGSNYNGAVSLNGWVDEFRVSKGIARDWAPAFSGEQFIWISKFINNLNYNKIGTPAWSLKIKAMGLWKNLRG